MKIVFWSQIEMLLLWFSIYLQYFVVLPYPKDKVHSVHNENPEKQFIYSKLNLSVTKLF